jgi:DNA-binding SARP family transcriptional activator
MQVRLLGPVDILADGAPRPVAGRRRRAVLAGLALNSGAVVSADHLIDIGWPEATGPVNANTLQCQVSQLRQVMQDSTVIRAMPPGYLLDLGDEGTDVQVAQRLLREGTRAADPASRVRLLTEAAALWRGQPLADTTGQAWLDGQAQRLELLGLQVKRAWLDARLAAGEHAALLPELEHMAHEHPLDEQVHARLMLALYRCGRQSDALGAYQRVCRTLREELGLDPGAELRDLHTAILRQDLALSLPAYGPGRAGTPGSAASGADPAAQDPPGRDGPRAPVPAQLPLAVPAFAGRRAELARLDALLDGRGQGRLASPATVVISAVSGTAGVGKTALAVHWAHQVTGQFPDGQLYVNLRGFDPGGAAVEPGKVLREFIEAFGVPAAGIPVGLTARAGLYRSLLAGKRLLVLLDNAHSAEQVRPLLPGSPGCLALVTSRNELTGLVVTEGAHPLSLDLLGPGDARDLLACRLGETRLAAGPGAVAEIIRRCAGLPLALAIAATRAAFQPGFSLAAVAAELREASRALDPFGGGDPATDVRAVFSWSYRALTPAAARLFRLTGLYPGHSIGIAGAASAAAVPAGQARALLAELTRAHLLTEPAPGRYVFHDLLRAYARELAEGNDSAGDRAAAEGRIIEHYRHTAQRAAALLEPYVAPIALEPPPPAVAAEQLATAAAALRWFVTEDAALTGCVRLAAGHGSRAWQLAWNMTAFHMRRGWHADHETTQRTALDAARAAGDAGGEAHVLLSLALGFNRSGLYGAAEELFGKVLPFFEEAGDLARQATIHQGLSWVAESRGWPAEMLEHSLRGQELFRRAGNEPGLAAAANDIGYCYAMLGDYEKAHTYCQQALDTIRDLGETTWEALTWDSLGLIEHKRGNLRRSIDCYRTGVGILRAAGDRFNKAAVLLGLGDVQQSAGYRQAARRSFQDALQIFEDLGHPDADSARARLSGAQAAGGAGS